MNCVLHKTVFIRVSKSFIKITCSSFGSKFISRNVKSRVEITQNDHQQNITSAALLAKMVPITNAISKVKFSFNKFQKIPKSSNLTGVCIKPGNGISLFYQRSGCDYILSWGNFQGILRELTTEFCTIVLSLSYI